MSSWTACQGAGSAGLSYNPLFGSVANTQTKFLYISLGGYLAWSPESICWRRHHLSGTDEKKSQDDGQSSCDSPQHSNSAWRKLFDLTFGKESRKCRTLSKFWFPSLCLNDVITWPGMVFSIFGNLWNWNISETAARMHLGPRPFESAPQTLRSVKVWFLSELPL